MRSRYGKSLVKYPRVHLIWLEEPQRRGKSLVPSYKTQAGVAGSWLAFQESEAVNDAAVRNLDTGDMSLYPKR